MNYQEKYLKYKNKYIQLQKQLGGNELIIPEGTTSIDDHAFENKKLRSIKIPNSVRSIGDHAFANNELTSIIIHDLVTLISRYAFANNKLTSIKIPNSVTSIGDSAFKDNRELKNVILPAKFIDDINRIFGKNASTISYIDLMRVNFV